MIGVFDSGLGGLTVLQALKARMPEQSFLYFSDQKNAPYGTKSPEEIHRLTREAVAYMFEEGCDLVILACNTASAVALHDLQVDWLPQNDGGRNRRVLGVFVPIIEAMTSRDWGDNSPPTHTGLENVLLFATPATVASGAFARELKFRARDVAVYSQACPGLVDAIEAGDHGKRREVVTKFVKEGLNQIATPQSVALACTHYPIAIEDFRAALPNTTEIFSQPEIVAKSLADYLIRYPRFSDSDGRRRYVSSGDASHVSQEAAKFLGISVTFESKTT